MMNETVELCTFPDDDKDYCTAFSVPKAWLLALLGRMDALNNREGVDLERFLDNYVWDETYFIHEQAVCDGVVTSEAQVPAA